MFLIARLGTPAARLLSLRSKKRRLSEVRLLWALLVLIPVLHAQRRTGELRLAVVDSTGAGLEASGTLVSQAIQLKQSFSTDNQGRYVARNLPFGIYRLNLARANFGSYSTLLEIRSEVPLDYTATLEVAAI